MVAGLGVALAVGREVVQQVVLDRWGALGVVGLVILVVAAYVLWQVLQALRVRRRGGIQYTPEMVRRQIDDAAVGPPAFVEDGSLSRAALVVLNQVPKVLEVQTAYELFASDGSRLGTVTQIGQGRLQRLARIVTGIDQYLTHHFDVTDRNGDLVYRVTRPWKIFYSRLQVFDAEDRFLGSLVQANVFWKIRFELRDASGVPFATLAAENLRAWDFEIVDRRTRRQLAVVVKTWEGWTRTAMTRADCYVLRLHEPLPEAQRALVLLAPLMVDLGLKQDVRGLS